MMQLMPNRPTKSFELAYIQTDWQLTKVFAVVHILFCNSFLKDFGILNL